jgi:hypothetical protein
MTHTYLKRDDGKYDVGQWLRRPDGYDSFKTLFTVPSLKQAFTAVNMLNGGTRISMEALHLEEEE